MLRCSAKTFANLHRKPASDDTAWNPAVCPSAPLSREVRDHWSNALIHIGADTDPIKKIKYGQDTMTDIKYTFFVIVSADTIFCVTVIHNLLLHSIKMPWHSEPQTDFRYGRD